MAYIIKNNEIIAQVHDDHQAGYCEFFYHWIKEEINANFDFIGVNRSSGKISHARKWDKKAKEREIPSAVVLDKYYERDFLVLDDDIITPSKVGWEWKNKGK